MIDLQAIASKWHFLTDSPVFLACSGGVDSIVLADLLASFCKKVTLLHVNYQLRGADSDADENLVLETARKYNFGCEILRVDLKKILADEGGNLQETARKIRFEWFSQKIGKSGFLMLAHHADDQIETFYQHLARKSGVRGLACMKERDGRLIRPLLAYSKTELYSYAKVEKLLWNEDLSNQKNAYTRNKLRNTFLPFLYEKLPDLRSSVLLLIEIFQKRLLELEEEVKPVYDSFIHSSSLSFEAYDKLSEDHQFELWRKLGFSATQQSQIDALIKAQKGKKIQSPLFQLIREKDFFALSALHPESKKHNLLVEAVSELPTVFDKSCIYLDAEKLVGKLHLSPWKIGDRMEPIGMSGSKLISDILTESGVANAVRSEQLVVRDELHIHWCVGLKIGRRAIANENSKTILKIKIEELNAKR